MVTLRPRKAKAAAKMPATKMKNSKGKSRKATSAKKKKTPAKKNKASKTTTLTDHLTAGPITEKGAQKVLTSFLDKIDDARKQGEIRQLYDLIRQHAPDQAPEEQGGKTLGFGGFDYKTKSGCSGRWARIGIMINKTGLSLFVSGINNGKYLLESYDKQEIGKASVGKSCIRFKRLEDLNLEVVSTIIGEMNSVEVINAV